MNTTMKTLRRRATSALAPLLLLVMLPACMVQAEDARPTGAEAATATFAGGCFWCVEADFDKVEGVLSTVSGYMGGHVEEPTYEQVAAKRTGHAEVVQVRYDPQQVSYAQLVEYFWRHIDPTVKDRQFCDIGSPYRTAIFTHSPEQRAIAEASRKALDDSGVLPAPVVTEITDAGPFYAAEDYHQDYYTKNPLRYRYYRLSCGRDARLQELYE